jgi:hypothetical protein
VVERVNLLRLKSNEGVREVHQFKLKRIGKIKGSCRVPMTDFIVFTATRAEEQRGEERWGLGPFIGGGLLVEGARVWAYRD